MRMIPRDELDYSQVEILLGQTFFDDEQMAAQAQLISTPEAQNIGRSNPARMRIFADVLAAAAGRTIDTDNDAIYLQMLKNLEAYIKGDEIEQELRGHQLPVFDDLEMFLNGTHPAESEPFSLSRSGYIEKPTSGGKMFDMVKLTEALVAPFKPEDRPKTLVLAPRRAITAQFMGSRGRGFAMQREDSQLKVTGPTSKGYDLSGDVIAMTYAAFLRPENQEALQNAGVKIILCDEAHRAIGKKTEAALRDFSKDKIFLGFTATTEFGVNHNVGNLFKVPIHKLSFAEGAKLGIFQPVQAYLYDTKVDVELDPSSSEFTQKEYDRLIAASGRTEKGIQFAAALVQAGLRGRIACIPGNNREHARNVAESLRRVMIATPQGERNVRAVALDGNYTSKQQQQVLEAFGRGEIDVICDVSVLDEGYDDDDMGFLINLQPTDSSVKETQRIGRILRKNPNRPPSVLIEFVDRTKKFQQTFMQVFDVDKFEQGKVYLRNDGNGGEHVPSNRTIILPETVRQELENVDIERIEEQIFRQELTAAPEGYMTMRETAAAIEVEYKDVSRAIDKLSLDVDRYIAANKRIAYHLSPEQIAIVEEFIKTGKRPVGLAMEPGWIDPASRSAKLRGKFQPLHEAIEDIYSTDGPFYSRPQFRCEYRDWYMELERPGQDSDQKYFNSLSEQAKRIKTIIQLRPNRNYWDEAEFFGIDHNGNVVRVDRPGLDPRQFKPLQEQIGWKWPLAEDVTTEPATEEEIRRIEALLNLGRHGADITSTYAEDVPYKDEIAARFARLCERVFQESAGDGLKERFEMYIGDTILIITQNSMPGVDFPGATIRDRYVTSLNVANRENVEYQEFVLFYDGSLKSVEAILSEEEEEHGFFYYPVVSNAYSHVIREKTDLTGLTAALDVLEEKLGPEIDWENIREEDVIKAAVRTFEVARESFSPGYKVPRGSQEVLVRGLAFMLMQNELKLSTRDIVSYTGLSVNVVTSAISKARDHLADSRGISRGRLDSRYKELRSALPRQAQNL